MTWPKSYMRHGVTWLTSSCTSNILEAVTEKKRLGNAYLESSVEIKSDRSRLTPNNGTQYYYIVLKLTDADEAFFIMQETNS